MLYFIAILSCQRNWMMFLFRAFFPLFYFFKTSLLNWFLLHCYFPLLADIPKVYIREMQGLYGFLFLSDAHD